LDALGFGAAAWKVAARGRWIGWERPVREPHLGRVLNTGSPRASPARKPDESDSSAADFVLAMAAQRGVGERRYGESSASQPGEAHGLAEAGECRGEGQAAEGEGRGQVGPHQVEAGAAEEHRLDEGHEVGGG
jgi:hypothetical protein